MRYTNELNLPDAIVRAVQNDDYDSGGSYITASGITTPPRIRELLKAHGDDIEIDVADCIYRLMGQAVHVVLERAEKTALTEDRLYAEIDGVTISGKYDRLYLQDDCLQDYKQCSVWSVINETSPDWIAQLNVLRWLAEQNGYTIHKLEIIAILRDWSRGKAENTEGFPQHQTKVIPIPIWDHTEQFIRERLAIYKAAENKLPLCTNDERWYTGTNYAVVKSTGKPSGASGYRRAVKVFTAKDTNPKERAEALAGKLGAPHMVEHRPGRYNRCEGRYCPVTDFCSQWKGT